MCHVTDYTQLSHTFNTIHFTAKTHSCDQRLFVTNDFFCLAEARSLVTGSTVLIVSVKIYLTPFEKNSTLQIVVLPTLIMT